MAQHALRRHDLLRLQHGGAAHPTGEDVVLGFPGHLADRSGDFGTGGKWGGRKDGQDILGMLVGQYGCQCGSPVRRRDVRRQCQRIGESRACLQQFFETLEGGRRQLAELAAGTCQPVAGNPPQAMTVGQDGQTLAAQAAHPRHRLDGGEQVPERIDAHPACTTQSRFVDLISTERSVPLRSALHRAAADGHYRLAACGGTRRRHELPPGRHLIELHQDRLGIGVCRQPVEHVGKVDIEAGAEVEHRREADSLAVGAIEHSRRHGGRLRDQGNLPRLDRDGGGTGVEPVGRHHETAAARSENAHQVRLGGFENRLARRRNRPIAHLVPHPRADDHRAGAARAELSDDRRHLLQRGANDRQIGHPVEFAQTNLVTHEEQGAFPGADRHDRTTEFTGREIGQHHFGVATRFVRLGDHGHRGGMKEKFKVSDSHD
ncbi:MAG: hypothetical protein CAPSK01_001103 [Candidatus Accumulibacter vicinus]|uniref:Uncharacterized protein n=1 Tax=Candidatus Accumulibacter vicinus TaxID=2954382 RepID=A0A084Y3R3_9PROT|nr:MAG: hypothetical protein CAPSK01_001103 [Candidatus Accumulibacter vicinus]